MDEQYKLFPSYKNPFDIADVWSRSCSSQVTDAKSVIGNTFSMYSKLPLQQTTFGYSRKLQEFMPTALSSEDGFKPKYSLNNLLLSFIDTQHTCDMPNNNISFQSNNGHVKFTSFVDSVKLLQKDEVCIFCKSNKEPPSFYKSHTIKDSSGNVTCPVLFKYVCTFCGATGKNSHTDSYCDKNPLKGFSHYKEFNCFKRPKTPNA